VPIVKECVMRRALDLLREVKRHRVKGDQVDTAGAGVAVDRAFGEVFPGLKETVGVVVAEGDLVAVAGTASGTHEGAFYGVPATGKTAGREGLDLMRFTCGKISEGRVSADALGLHQQLGAITEEERTSVETPTP
jgi:predicted ester cyclase